MHPEYHLIVTRLVPHKTASILVRSVCTIQHYTMLHHFMQSHILRVHVCLAVTCHCTSGRMTGILACYCITQGWNTLQNKSQHRKLTLELKILLPLLLGLKPVTFNHKSGAQNAALSALPKCRSSFKLHCQVIHLHSQDLLLA